MHVDDLAGSVHLRAAQRTGRVARVPERRWDGAPRLIEMPPNWEQLADDRLDLLRRMAEPVKSWARRRENEPIFSLTYPRRVMRRIRLAPLHARSALYLSS